MEAKMSKILCKWIFSFSILLLASNVRGMNLIKTFAGLGSGPGTQSSDGSATVANIGTVPVVTAVPAPANVSNKSVPQATIPMASTEDGITRTPAMTGSTISGNSQQIPQTTAQPADPANMIAFLQMFTQSIQSQEVTAPEDRTVVSSILQDPSSEKHGPDSDLVKALNKMMNFKAKGSQITINYIIGDGNNVVVGVKRKKHNKKGYSKRCHRWESKGGKLDYMGCSKLSKSALDIMRSLPEEERQEVIEVLMGEDDERYPRHRNWHEYSKRQYHNEEDNEEEDEKGWRRE